MKRNLYLAAGIGVVALMGCATSRKSKYMTPDEERRACGGPCPGVFSDVRRIETNVGIFLVREQNAEQLTRLLAGKATEIRYVAERSDAPRPRALTDKPGSTP